MVVTLPKHGFSKDMYIKFTEDTIAKNIEIRLTKDKFPKDMNKMLPKDNRVARMWTKSVIEIGLSSKDNHAQNIWT